MNISSIFKGKLDKILKEDKISTKNETLEGGGKTTQNSTTEKNTVSSSSKTGSVLTVEERAKYLPAYVKSAQVLGAERAYEAWKKSAPSVPDLSYTDDIERLSAYLEGRKFTYDYRDDPTYIAMKDSAIKQGRMAMEDTLGRAAALNGGYSTSYGATAASLAYNRYLAEVDNVIPELYEAAYNMYKEEGDSIKEQIELLQGLNDDEWSRYNDMLSAYYDEGKMLFDELTNVTKTDYNNYLNYYKLLLG